MAVDVRATKLTIGISKHPITYDASFSYRTSRCTPYKLTDDYYRKRTARATVKERCGSAPTATCSARYKPARNTQLWATWASPPVQTCLKRHQDAESASRRPGRHGRWIPASSSKLLLLSPHLGLPIPPHSVPSAMV